MEEPVFKLVTLPVIPNTFVPTIDVFIKLPIVNVPLFKFPDDNLVTTPFVAVIFVEAINPVVIDVDANNVDVVTLVARIDATVTFVILAPPETSSAYPGAVVPIPILPFV